MHNGEEGLKETHIKEKGKNHPVLVCGQKTEQRDGEFYLRVEGKIMHIGGNFLSALNLFIKFHYIFDVDFPSHLKNFYNFLTSIIDLETPNISSKTFFNILNETSE